MELDQKKCIPCKSGGMSLTEEEAKKILVKTPNWELKGNKIEREFVFKNFVDAMKFVNVVRRKSCIITCRIMNNFFTRYNQL